MSAAPNTARKIPSDDDAFSQSNKTEATDFSDIDKAFYARGEKFEKGDADDIELEPGEDTPENKKKAKGIVERFKNVFGFVSKDEADMNKGIEKIQKGEVGETPTKLTPDEGKKAADLKKRVYKAMNAMRTQKVEGADPVAQKAALYGMYEAIEKSNQGNLTDEVEAIYKKMVKVGAKYFETGKYSGLTDEENALLAEAEGRNITDFDIRAMINGERPWHAGAFVRARQMIERGGAASNTDDKKTANDNSDTATAAAVAGGLAVGVLGAVVGSGIAGANPDKDRQHPDNSIEVEQEEMIKDLHAKLSEVRETIKRTEAEIEESFSEGEKLLNIGDIMNIDERITSLRENLVLISDYAMLVDPDAAATDDSAIYYKLANIELANIDKIVNESERQTAQVNFLDQRFKLAVEGLQKMRTKLIAERDAAYDEEKILTAELSKAEQVFNKAKEESQRELIKNLYPEEAKGIDALEKKLAEIKSRLTLVNAKDYARLSTEMRQIQTKIMGIWDKLRPLETTAEQPVEFTDKAADKIRQEIALLEDAEDKILLASVNGTSDLNKLRLKRIRTQLLASRAALAEETDEPYSAKAPETEKKRLLYYTARKRGVWHEALLDPLHIETLLEANGNDAKLLVEKKIKSFKALDAFDQFSEMAAELNLSDKEKEALTTEGGVEDAIDRYLESYEELLIDLGQSKKELEKKNKEAAEKKEQTIRTIEDALMNKINAAEKPADLWAFKNTHELFDILEIMVGEGIAASELEHLSDSEIQEIYAGVLVAVEARRKEINIDRKTVDIIGLEKQAADEAEMAVTKGTDRRRGRSLIDDADFSAAGRAEAGRVTEAEIDNILTDAHTRIENLDVKMISRGKKMLKSKADRLKRISARDKVGDELREILGLEDFEIASLSNEDMELLKNELAEKIETFLEKGPDLKIILAAAEANLTESKKAILDEIENAPPADLGGMARKAIAKLRDIATEATDRETTIKRLQDLGVLPPTGIEAISDDELKKLTDQRVADLTEIRNAIKLRAAALTGTTEPATTTIEPVPASTEPVPAAASAPIPPAKPRVRVKAGMSIVPGTDTEPVAKERTAVDVLRETEIKLDQNKKELMDKDVSVAKKLLQNIEDIPFRNTEENRAQLIGSGFLSKTDAALLHSSDIMRLRDQLRYDVMSVIEKKTPTEPIPAAEPDKEPVGSANREEIIESAYIKIDESKAKKLADATMTVEDARNYASMIRAISPEATRKIARALVDGGYLKNNDEANELEPADLQALRLEIIKNAEEIVVAKEIAEEKTNKTEAPITAEAVPAPVETVSAKDKIIDSFADGKRFEGIELKSLGITSDSSAAEVRAHLLAKKILNPDESQELNDEEIEIIRDQIIDTINPEAAAGDAPERQKQEDENVIEKTAETFSIKNIPDDLSHDQITEINNLVAYYFDELDKGVRTKKGLQKEYKGKITAIIERP